MYTKVDASSVNVVDDEDAMEESGEESDAAELSMYSLSLFFFIKFIL